MNWLRTNMHDSFFAAFRKSYRVMFTCPSQSEINETYKLDTSPKIALESNEIEARSRKCQFILSAVYWMSVRFIVIIFSFLKGSYCWLSYLFPSRACLLSQHVTSPVRFSIARLWINCCVWPPHLIELHHGIIFTWHVFWDLQISWFICRFFLWPLIGEKGGWRRIYTTKYGQASNLYQEKVYLHLPIIYNF